MGVHDKLNKALADHGVQRDELQPAVDEGLRRLVPPTIPMSALVFSDDSQAAEEAGDVFEEWLGQLSAQDRSAMASDIQQLAVPLLPKPLQGAPLKEFLAAIDGDPAKVVLEMLAWTP